MKCVGCDKELGEGQEAAYAIMHDDDWKALNLTPTYSAESGKFHSGPVCRECHVDPTHRKRKLKAHFALPGQNRRMTENAGSSTSIG